MGHDDDGTAPDLSRAAQFPAPENASESRQAASRRARSGTIVRVRPRLQAPIAAFGAGTSWVGRVDPGRHDISLHPLEDALATALGAEIRLRILTPARLETTLALEILARLSATGTTCPTLFLIDSPEKVLDCSELLAHGVRLRAVELGAAAVVSQACHVAIAGLISDLASADQLHIRAGFAYRGSRRLSLTEMDLRLLEYLLRRAGEVVSFDDIARDVTGIAGDSTHRSRLHRLRKAIGESRSEIVQRVRSRAVTIPECYVGSLT